MVGMGGVVLDEDCEGRPWFQPWVLFPLHLRLQVAWSLVPVDLKGGFPAGRCLSIFDRMWGHVTFNLRLFDSHKCGNPPPWTFEVANVYNLVRPDIKNALVLFCWWFDDCGSNKSYIVWWMMISGRTQIWQLPGAWAIFGTWSRVRS